MTRPKDLIKYWTDSADIDFKAMDDLFKNGHYMWSLFMGHLVLEKLLKAYYIKNINTSFPYTHDLYQIAEKSGLELSEAQKDFLDEVTTFNIKARYPDYKHRFYKKAGKSFANAYFQKMKEFRLWLLERIIV
ncbi:MAG: HEPN domain-containing protein [Planctomycetota bacterium]|mgnify:CR=1 FL=1